jgi:phosphoribosylanthranilate isomerase
VTSVEHARVCVDAGVDAIGMVFYAPSPRCVTVEQARHIVAALPPFVSAVGLFVDEQPAVIREVLAAVDLDLLQFHGDESAEACEALQRPYIKAIRVRQREDLSRACSVYRHARGILADAYVDGVAGGTGRQFDWSLATGRFDKDIILAGGLDAANVRQAMQQVRPFAVDVSGGVESSRGVKDAAKIQQFMQEVQRGNYG